MNRKNRILVIGYIVIAIVVITGSVMVGIKNYKELSEATEESESEVVESQGDLIEELYEEPVRILEFKDFNSIPEIINLDTLKAKIQSYMDENQISGSIVKCLIPQHTVIETLSVLFFVAIDTEPETVLRITYECRSGDIKIDTSKRSVEEVLQMKEEDWKEEVSN